MEKEEVSHRRPAPECGHFRSIDNPDCESCVEYIATWNPRKNVVLPPGDTGEYLITYEMETRRCRPLNEFRDALAARALELDMQFIVSTNLNIDGLMISWRPVPAWSINV